MTTQQLQTAVNQLVPGAILGTGWTASTDSTGAASITYWNPSLGSQPTEAQLSTALAAAQLRAAKVAQTNSLTAAYKTARYGTPVSITAASGKSLSFPTDMATQDNVTKYLAVMQGMKTKPASVPLVDAGGAVQSLAPSDVQALAEAILSASQAAFTKLMSLQAQVQAATTIADVQAVVW